MERIVPINERGSLTLPKDLRAKYGLDGAGQIVIEESPEGLLIRPCATFPVEIYSEERIKEFNQSNEIDLEGFDLE
jgi:bifunctional DNA-binding transcriptional regulator/antitoxin component of YhaV-PrlF toxin-antitoxin module